MPLGFPKKTDRVKPRNFSPQGLHIPTQLKTSYPTQPAKGAGFTKASYLKGAPFARGQVNNYNWHQLINKTQLSIKLNVFET